jgi:hypothetical protein
LDILFQALEAENENHGIFSHRARGVFIFPAKRLKPAVINGFISITTIKTKTKKRQKAKVFNKSG